MYNYAFWLRISQKNITYLNLEDPNLNYNNSPFRITFAMYPKAQAPVRFPLEWLGKPHGGLENITEQQNNNVCGRERGRADNRRDGCRAEGKGGGRIESRAQPAKHTRRLKGLRGNLRRLKARPIWSVLRIHVKSYTPTAAYTMFFVPKETKRQRKR